MRHFNQGRFRQQVRFLQHHFLQDGNLPFSDILSTERIEQALTALQVGLIDCVYTPLVTLCVFLGQVLSADHSCRAAVARLIAYRVARKQRVLAGNERLLPSSQTVAGRVLLADRAADGAPARCQREIELVVEESTRVHLRRCHRLDA